MSVEAISWALNLAPVPTDRGGQPSSACKFVLGGLANHAGPDGACAFPSVATLVRYTGLSERTVPTCLGRLEAEGIIRPCDPDIVAARIKRADRRPKGWDLDLSLIRRDLTDADIAALGHQFPGLAARVAAIACPDGEAPDGVQSPHPAGTVDNMADEVRPLHPASGTGRNQPTDGVQRAQPRGAAVAPELSREPSLEPPAATARAREAAPVGGVAGGGEPVGEFFAALGNCWRLTPTQRLKLTPVITAALDEGWTPRVLAAFTGANTSGVHSPYAVLAARLSPAELPSPSARPARPPWCGECDQTTRMLGFHGDAPRPCPRCKPPAGTQPDSPGPDGPHRLDRRHARHASIGAHADGRRGGQPQHRERPGATFDQDPVHAGRQ
jgi:hypothetical protein